MCWTTITANEAGESGRVEFCFLGVFWCCTIFSGEGAASCKWFRSEATKGTAKRLEVRKGFSDENNDGSGVGNVSDESHRAENQQDGWRYSLEPVLRRRGFLASRVRQAHRPRPRATSWHLEYHGNRDNAATTTTTTATSTALSTLPSTKPAQVPCTPRTPQR